jgi:hypothetical protein
VIKENLERGAKINMAEKWGKIFILGTWST